MPATILPVRSEDEGFSSFGVEREQSIPLQSSTESGIIPEPDPLAPENSTTKRIYSTIERVLCMHRTPCGCFFELLHLKLYILKST